ncbi:hypothetical protein LIER_42599 [Lithospermum erythrorhizon]|uniref:Pentatricopeptide repeat-containing protein n=1 Tax=Lithospermum erythrorhizon TaxID=34254 RepID=A0AAV3NPN6_LITER
MAFPRSTDCSLVCINNNARFIHDPYCKKLFFFPFICPNSRTIIITTAYSSSSCSSPPTVLESNTNHSSSKNSSLIELNLNLQDFPSTFSTEDLNGLIYTLFEDAETENIAYEYYEKARKKPDFFPQKPTLRLLIRYLLRSKNWNKIHLLVDDFKEMKVLPDSSTCCRLIGSCVRERKFKIASIFLDHLVRTDKQVAVLALDSAMKGYNKLHMYRSSLQLYSSYKNLVSFNIGCYCYIMEAYLKMGKYEEVVMIFQEFVEKWGNEADICSVNASATAKIYWILCDALGKMGRCFEALGHFREMAKKSIRENHSFYSSLICSFASIREVGIVEELLVEAEKKQMLRDPALFLKLVLMYIEEGMMEKTIVVVGVMKRVNIRVSDCIFCAIVNGFSKKRGHADAVKVYEELVQQQGIEPGQVTYASIQCIYCRLGLYSKAEMVFTEMVNKGYDKCVVAYSSMVDMYGKTGRLEDAMRLLGKMKERGCEPNVWIYNTLLDMHGKALNFRQVEKIWKEMKRRKISPDRVSYTTMITIYSKARELENSVKYYNEFKLNGGKLDRAMAGIMVSVFSKMNLADELVKLLQDLKAQGTKLDGRLYRSAINALRDTGIEFQVI